MSVWPCVFGIDNSVCAVLKFYYKIEKQVPSCLMMASTSYKPDRGQIPGIRGADKVHWVDKVFAAGIFLRTFLPIYGLPLCILDILR